MKITLKWDGPLKLYNIEKSSSDVIQEKYLYKKGIYLFGCKHKETFIINYVGKSDNLLKRMREHIVSTLGGAYSLLDCNKIENSGFTERKYQLENDLSMINYLKGYKDLSELAFQNIKSSYLFIATEKTESYNLKILESAFINHFKNNEKSKVHIQNYGLSKYNKTGESIIINSEFKNE